MIKKNILLILILLAAFAIRTFGLNWDQGNHLHPDERMIIMVTDKIKFPHELNPKFFAYGSLPIYLLKIVSLSVAKIFPPASTYDYTNLIGRFISAIFDTLTIFFLYKISFLLTKSKKISLLSALLYTICVFPVQLSHFYAVDTLLNFFIYAILYFCLLEYSKHSFLNIVFMGIFTGLCLATKISGFPVLIPILIVLLFRPNKIKNLLIFSFLSFFVFFISMPYAILDFTNFFRQLKDQQAMTKNAYVFPYTLQYVNTLPYLYPLKNIFIWGIGPIISILSFISIINFKKLLKYKGFLLFIIFPIIYFLIVGRFAVKFMRYLLPIYPLICLLAAIYLYKCKYKIIFILFQFFILISFLKIYIYPNTRVSASEWINDNIPSGSTILREHWDDGLPLDYASNFKLQDLTLYDSDKYPSKWTKINKQLKDGDYIVIASNRLWVPLTKLSQLYPITSKYYSDLFSEKLDYKLIKEFNSYPSIFGFDIIDQSADESFTVYDHPQIFIFKKI